jgi:hypothetical protein
MNPMEPKSKLLPVLRDAVSIVKMVLFKELKKHLKHEYPQEDATGISRLAGAVVNELFGTPNTSTQFAQFAAENEQRIQSELDKLSVNFEYLKIPLTDALRVQFLCDSLEGIDSGPALKKAESISMLMVERDVPLPKTFMAMVRRVGAAHNILQSAEDPVADSSDINR